MVLSAVKCVYSSDYHVVGDSFICSSGRFNVGSVIHEFLHQVVHSEVTENKDLILSGKRKYEGIDPSYFLGSDDKGFLNAFEEYLVRALTQKVMNGSLPADLGRYIREIL
ncbi:MAG: hypothetical protein IKZ19_09935 [Clostridia bacterium]|nr:hypothetical protein [Clostridia bacterium]